MQWKAEKSRHTIQPFHPIQPFHTIQLRLYTKESRNQYKSTIARVSFYKCFFLKIIQNAGFKELCLFLICAASQYSHKKHSRKPGPPRRISFLAAPVFTFCAGGYDLFISQRSLAICMAITSSEPVRPCAAACAEISRPGIPAAGRPAAAPAQFPVRGKAPRCGQ